MSRPPAVHVIDDDASLRGGLESLFRSVGLDARGYGSAQQFLEADVGDTPGCLVLDVRLPGLSGLDFQARLEALGVRLPVVLMTGHGDIPMSVQAMKAGAVDFLAKPFREQDMLDAVNTALERDAARRAGDADVVALRAAYASLSPRERQIMALATTGRMNKQIAHDLSLSEVTVKIHRGSVMRKMAARTFADLVRMADALGLG
ncbi:response regulator transcription factor [Caulobacter sp. 602-2]|uniref:Response regulator transcription factor n=1 Tax=Caulobacter sp. 602-2 TaxID=2710887 RepID=A0A6G4QWE3_9CAUL|nr:response regulator transcription factor [Caulobacter sp. 602-2]NGM49777.1 response regulator transcription factor [Caulobacter sp. 602-2]